MDTVDWTDLYAKDESGLDQLGMRVAGETAYVPLIDFTTTVTWRPRYYSFLCWSLRDAWHAAGGTDSAEEHRIDTVRWRTKLRRNDVAVAAATILVDPHATRIAGSNALETEVEAAKVSGVLSLDVNYLAAPTGSLATYAGVLSSLGLLRVAGGIFRPTQLGNDLADTFATNMRAAEVRLDEHVTVAELQRLGAACALSMLAPNAETSATVREERDKIRDVVIEGNAAQHPLRVPTIGLLLRAHRDWEGTRTVDDFRRLLVLGRVGRNQLAREWSLPAGYDRARAVWRSYAAHSYATLALEALLSLVLESAQAEANGRDDGVSLVQLLTSMAREATEEDQASLSSFVGNLEESIRASRDEELEPGLLESLRRLRSGGQSRADSARSAVRLLLLSVLRLRAFLERDGAGAWLGDRTHWRRPPAVLVDHLERALASDESVVGYVERVLRELVVEQHRNNALRKLASDRTKYTALFDIDGGQLIPLQEHRPGTSNPRFGNAVLVLQDLGWLSRGERVLPTSDGQALLDRIEAG